MHFKKFTEFLKQREVVEENLNRSALDYDKKLAQFNSRFSDPKQAAEILSSAGYKNIRSFVSDPNENKWSKLKMPGQENYVK